MLSRGNGSGMTAGGDFDVELQRLRQRMSSMPSQVAGPATTSAAVGATTTPSVPAYMQGAFNPVALRTEKPRSTNPNPAVHDELETLRYLKRSKLDFEVATQPIEDFAYDEDIERKATNKTEKIYNDPFMFIPNLATAQGGQSTALVSQHQLDLNSELIQQRIQDDVVWSNKLEDREIEERSRQLTQRRASEANSSTALTVRKTNIGGGLTPTRPPDRTSTASTTAMSTTSTRIGGGKEKGKEFKYARGVDTKGLYDVDLSKPLPSGKPAGNSSPVKPKPAASTLITNDGGVEKQRRAKSASASSRAGNSSVVHVKYRRACEYETTDEGRIHFCHECHRVVLGEGVGSCPHCGAAVRESGDVTDSATSGVGNGAVGGQSEDALLIAEIEERERLAFQDAIKEWRAAGEGAGGEGTAGARTSAVGADGRDSSLTSIRPPMKPLYFLHLWEQLPFTKGAGE